MKLFLLNCDINWPNFTDRDCVYFPSFQYNVFLVLCFRHLISHEIWTSKIVKLDFLENEKSFSSETKTFSLIWQVFLFRIKNQTIKNIVDTVIQQRNKNWEQNLNLYWASFFVLPNLPCLTQFMPLLPSAF